MKIRKDMIFAVLTTFCMCALMFAIIPIRSSLPYDPWADLRGPYEDPNIADGKIDMRDIGYLASMFMTTGTPINKTELLLQLLNRLDQLNATVIEQQNTINNLNQTVAYLNETVTILNSTGLRAPDYDSGWRSVPAGSLIYLTHNLNTTELLVYFMGKYDYGNEWIHQYCFGGSSGNPHDLTSEYGAWWALTNTTINLYRGSLDNVSGMPWQYARVMIWKIPQP